MPVYTIDNYLTKIINNDLLKNSFLDSAKNTSVRPALKIQERKEIEN